MNSPRWGREAASEAQRMQNPGEMGMFLGCTTGESGWRRLRDGAEARGANAGSLRARRVLGVTPPGSSGDGRPEGAVAEAVGR